MGFKDVPSASKAIMNNLKNDVIYSKFIENIESSLKKKKLNLHNGVEFTYKLNTYSCKQDKPFGEIITLNVVLKKVLLLKIHFINLVVLLQIVSLMFGENYRNNIWFLELFYL